MNSMTTRIARITAASALALGLGAMAAGPALAQGGTWSGSVPPTVTSDGGATTDSIVRGSGVKAVEDGSGTEILILSGGIDTQQVRAADDARTDTYNSWAG